MIDQRGLRPALPASPRAMLVAVHRAVAELRRGEPVVLADADGRSALALPAEMASGPTLARLRAEGGRLYLALTAPRAEPVSGICAVLAETDVINMVSRGISTAEILRGIHESIAQRLAKLLRTAKASSPVLVTGGLAADTGLLAQLTERLAAEGGTPVEVLAHPLSMYAGALGAALWGAYRQRKLAASPSLPDDATAA